MQRPSHLKLVPYPPRRGASPHSNIAEAPMSFSFPFTFRFSVPGLPNPFYSSAPAAQPSTGTDVRRDQPVGQGPTRKRTFDSSFHDRDIKRPSGPPPSPLVRKRGWVPASSMPSEATVVPASPTGFLDSPSKYGDLYDMVDRSDGNREEVELGACAIHVLSRLD